MTDPSMNIFLICLLIVPTIVHAANKFCDKTNYPASVMIGDSCVYEPKAYEDKVIVGKKDEKTHTYKFDEAKKVCEADGGRMLQMDLNDKAGDKETIAKIHALFEPDVMRNRVGVVVNCAIMDANCQPSDAPCVDCGREKPADEKRLPLFKKAVIDFGLYADENKNTLETKYEYFVGLLCAFPAPAPPPIRTTTTTTTTTTGPSTTTGAPAQRRISNMVMLAMMTIALKM